MNSLQCNVSKRLTWLLLPVMAVFFMVNSVWATGANVGLVVDISPEVWLLRGTEKIPLALKSGVAAEDTLITGPDGRVQVLFEDDTVLTLGPSSRVLVAEYLYDGTAASHLEFDFAAGLSRVVTGKMVEANREGFKMRTPLSTMGIRGTMLSVLLPTLEGAKPENTIAQGAPEKVVLEQIGAGHNLSIQSAGVEVTMNRAGITAQVSPGTAPGLAPTTAEESRALQALAPTAAKAQAAEQPAEQPASQGTAKQESTEAQGGQEGQAAQDGQEGGQEGSAAGTGEAAPAAGQGTTTGQGSTTGQGTTPGAAPGTGSGITTGNVSDVNVGVNPPNLSGNNGQITTPIPKPESPSVSPGPGNNKPGTGNQPGNGTPPGNGVIDPIAPVPPKPPVDNGGGIVPPPTPDPTPDPGPGNGGLPFASLDGAITSLNYSPGNADLALTPRNTYLFQAGGSVDSPTAVLDIKLKNSTWDKPHPYLNVTGTASHITTGPNGTTVEFSGINGSLGVFLGKVIETAVVTIHQDGSQIRHDWTIATRPEQMSRHQGTLNAGSNLSGGTYTQAMSVYGLQIGVLTLTFNLGQENARLSQADMRGLGVAESDFHLSQSVTPKVGNFELFNLLPVGDGPQKLFGADVKSGYVTGGATGQVLGSGSWRLYTNGSLTYSGSTSGGQ